MQEKNPHAAALGRLARGVRKTITQAEREARRLRLAEARKSRWPKIKTEEKP